MNQNLRVRRIRHELVGREVIVAEVESVSPRMLRLHFESPELEGFHSPAADDHIAIFPLSPEGEEVKRHYTPRAFDPARRRLTVDFALHEAGPATHWAERARVGDALSIGGPRSSLDVSEGFDWYLLIGDETALPAIGRRVETLRAGVPVWTVVLLFDEREEQRFVTEADWSPSWVLRGEPSLADAAHARAAVEQLRLPEGNGFVWIAGEASLARELRAWFFERGHPRKWIHASSYWKLGVADVHEVFEEE